MKIQNEQLEALRRSQEQQARKSGQCQPGQAFGDILSQEVSRSEAPAAAQAASAPLPMAALGQLLQVQAPPEVAPAGKPAAELAAKVEEMLGQWENYAQALKSPADGPGLRQANGLLNGIEGGIKGIKADWPDLASQNPGLHGLVTELDVLAATERIKFNRGDYL